MDYGQYFISLNIALRDDKMQRIIKYLDKTIYWSIIFMPFSIAIAPAFTYILIFFLVFAFILKKILKKEKLFINTSINLPFAFLIFVSIISFKNSIDYLAGLRGIARLFQNAFIFLICAQEIKDRKHIDRIILFIILGASLASFNGVWQYIFGKDFIRGHILQSAIGLKRSTAAFPNPNVFGVYLSAVTPLIIGLTLYYFRGAKKIIMFIVSALATTGIILALSRGTGLALYLAVLFISICRKNKVVLTALLVLLLIFPFIAPQDIKDWAKKVNYNPIIFMCNADRISIYRNTANMIKHHPIIGVGINTFSRNYFQYKLPEPDDAKSGDSMYAHNHFLQMAGEIGLLGLGIFFWLLFRLFKKSAYIYRNLKDEYYKIISLCLFACLLAFLINGLTETSLYYSRVAMIFWYLIGFCLSLEKFIHANRAQSY